MKKIGFIGMGNMAKAMAIGLIDAGKVAAADMLAFAPNQEKLAKNAAEVGFAACSSACEVAERSDMVVMACKPYQIESVLAEVGDQFCGKALISVAAGWDFARYDEALRRLCGGDATQVRVQCIMPNTPVQVREGVFLLEEQHSLTADERQWLIELLSATGSVIELPGALVDAASAVTGCGPAFIDMMMEALADAAVKHGIKRPDAYQMVAQMVVGAGKLMLETGQHPGVLKDAVCSPGGTTIRGVDALEHAGMRAAFIDAVDATLR